jgi:hypothetical protein
VGERERERERGVRGRERESEWVLNEREKIYLGLSVTDICGRTCGKVVLQINFQTKSHIHCYYWELLFPY